MSIEEEKKYAYYADAADSSRYDADCDGASFARSIINIMKTKTKDE